MFVSRSSRIGFCRSWFAAFIVGICSVGVSQTVAPILDTSYGYRLPSSPGCAVWWCEATYKVGRTRALPAATNDAVFISAARNEYEPFQIVLRPETNLNNMVVSITDFVHDDGRAAGSILRSNVEMCLVEYVPVTTLTDSSGAVGPHPDPLPPLTGPFSAAGGSNQPVWVTVYVPKDTPAGNYEAALTLQAGSYSFTTPVRLRVRNFALPEVTHTRTAYYADVHVDPTWHQLATLEQKRQVWDLYMQNFRKHRISPYSAHLYAPPVWSLVNGEFQIDFSDFDAALTRYVDEFGFNAFNLFGHKSPPFPYSLGGYSAFSPQWRELFAKLMRPIQAHLRERGWAEEAYCYWTDEPQGPGFINLLNGMRALNEGAPGLRRLLTFNAYPAAEYDAQLNGQVDIWVPMLPMGAADRFLNRQAAGDENWWYVCVGPHAPHPNNFIDHPAINHRIRFWMAEKSGITGDLYWAVNYWIGRNPWANPWSFANGDGVLIYPPTKTPPTGPVLAGPINSLRWELTREALEDGEYFWLLRQHITNAMPRLGPEHPAVTEAIDARAAALTLVPNTTQYEKNPQRLYASRDRIAQAIEGLDSGAPMIVRQPQSRALPAGESATLRVEVLGWPPPAYQWKRNGQDVPGATNSVLALNNFNPSLAGDYQVMATNSAGMATSAVARVEGYWGPLPRIVAHPDGLVRPASEQAVFAVTAVSSNALSYLWLHNGRPAEGVAATNASLLLTNLTVTRAGDYSVVVSTAAGAVTSSVARLTVLASTDTLALVSGGASWRYHNLGEDLGGDWQATLYNDSLWPAGPAPLGFGEGDERTVIGSDRRPGNAPTTFYFRHVFPFAQTTLQSSLNARLLCDDGAVVFLNGDEIFRHNLPDEEVNYLTPALQAVEGDAESQFVTFVVPADLLRPGSNVLAVEVHQSAADLPKPAQPAAYWSFNHPVFPWHDHVGTNDFAPVSGNVVVGPGRFWGGASNSASATSYLMAADSSELDYSGPFTVGGWFAFGAGTANRAVGLEKTGEFSLYYTGASLNRYRFELNGAYVQDPTSGTVAGQWRFVVGWFDGTNINIQVDNGVVSSAPANPPRPTSSPLVALHLAQSSGGISADELFLYKRVLSASERTAHFQNQLGLNPSDLKFDFALTAIAGQLPQLLSGPASLVRRTGENAAFTASAVSATPLTYQWYFKGAPLVGATRSLLFLGGVGPAQMGNYSVTIRNAAGEVTPPPAMLTVVHAPALRAVLAANGQGCVLGVPGSGVPGAIFVSSNLVDWSELVRLPALLTPTNIVDAGALNAPSRFYRLRLDW